MNFFKACRSCTPKAFRYFNSSIGSISNLNEYSKTGQLALVNVAGSSGRHDLEMAKILLYPKDFNCIPADINKKDRKNITPLLAATKNNKLDMIKYLIKNGADIHKQDCFEKSCKYSSLEIIKVFIEKGANVNDYSFPLKIAVKNQRENVVEELLKNKADPNLKFNYNFNYLLDDAITSHNLNIVKLLLEYGADPNLFAGIYSPLEKSIIFNDIHIVIELLNNNKTDKSKALLYSIKYNRLNILNMMLDRKDIPLDLKDENGDTCLIYASKRNMIDAVELLINKGVDTKCVDKKGKTYLDYLYKTQK